jgi:hypothetical protein
MRIKEVGYIVERLADRFRDLGGQMAGQEAAHKAALTEIRASFNARTSADEKIIEGLRAEIIRVNEAHGRTKVENDGLRDELTAQRDAFTAEVERIRRELHEGRDAEATVKLTPKVGDTVRLVTHPERARVAEHLRTALKWPWIDRWGVVGQTGKVVKPRDAVAGTVAVAMDDDSTVFARWPINCLEVVSEATHDTDAGKAVAESALKTEPVERGDLVKVFQATGSMTDAEDIGCGGVVREVDVDGVWLSRHYTMDLPRQEVASLSDVRKVTT